MSEFSYKQCQRVVEYIANNPKVTNRELAAALNLNSDATNHNVKALQSAGVLDHSTEKIRGGKAFRYFVTGKPMPPRAENRNEPLDSKPQFTTLDPVDQNEFIKLPSFMKALTPVVNIAIKHGRRFDGLTHEQQMLQSAQARIDRRVSESGVRYTGESSL